MRVDLSRLLVLVALLVGLGAGLWWWWGGPLSEEEQVAAVVQQALDGAREGDLGAVMETVAEDYQDDDGLQKDAIRGLLFREFAKRGPIGLTATPIAVTLEGEGQARAQFELLATEDAPGSLLPADAEALWFTVHLEPRDGSWRIVDHERGRVLGDD